MKKIAVVALFALGMNYVNAQEFEKEVSPFVFSGYLETYYSYDFGNPDNHLRPGFMYSHNKHNELNLNLGLVKASYMKGIVRANLALMTGTYAQYNLAACTSSN